MKKLLVLLGMITCMACLAACGQEEAASGPISEDYALEIGTTTIESINAIVAGNAIEQYANQPVLYNGILDWQDALEDIGTYEGTNGGSVSFEEDQVVINIEVLGSSHDATVEVVLDSALASYIGIITNVHYSTGEILAKAGMNTLIGMGTVFAVLILISLIISCFTLVSKFEKKQQKTEAPAPAADPVVEQIAAKEELSDDTELVAVIAAAIAAYEGAASTDGFVVRSIRKSNKSKWQNA